MIHSHQHLTRKKPEGIGVLMLAVCAMGEEENENRMASNPPVIREEQRRTRREQHIKGYCVT